MKLLFAGGGVGRLFNHGDQGLSSAYYGRGFEFWALSLGPLGDGMTGSIGFGMATR